MRKQGLIYLASPYQHADDAVQHRRFTEACRAAAWLIHEGYLVFSPIAHSRSIAAAFTMLALPQPNGFTAWRDFDLLLLSKCDGLIVLYMEGYERSVGVQAEITEAYRLGMPVEYLAWSPGPEERLRFPSGVSYGVGGVYDPSRRRYRLLPFLSEVEKWLGQGTPEVP